MNLQVLVSTLNQKEPFSLIEKMKINSDAIIVNQTDNISYEKKYINENNVVQIYNFNERGVGLNRNSALMRATSDIVLIADDDIEYVDNYKEIILTEFKNNPKADMIIFNLESSDLARPRFKIKKYKRVHQYNCLRYGAVRIAFRLNKIREKNVYFSLLFGGGAKYSSGEDSLFILECIRKGIKIYSSPKNIGTIHEGESSWFKGYNKKFFYDKGVFHRIAFEKLANLMNLQFVLRHKKMLCGEIKLLEAYKIMRQGTKLVKID